MAPRAGRAATPTDETTGDGIDVNAVVSYNLRAIRERRGMTQQAVADALARLTGHRLPQASISAMERGFDGERRRRFDAHELYLLSVVFDVPIAYFFLPPATGPYKELADTHRPVTELYRALLGTDQQLDVLDDRLSEIQLEHPEAVDESLAAIAEPERAVATGTTTTAPGALNGSVRSNAATATSSPTSPRPSAASPTTSPPSARPATCEQPPTAKAEEWTTLRAERVPSTLLTRTDPARSTSDSDPDQRVTAPVEHFFRPPASATSQPRSTAAARPRR